MSILDNIQTTAKRQPPIVLFHGPAGSRKTQAAIDAGALILQTENGLGNRDAAHLPIKTMADFYEVIKELATTDHAYPAVAVDSLDHMVPLVAAAVCEANGKPSLEAFGYGKGQAAEAEEWRKVFDYLIRLRNKKQIPVILIAHQAIRSVNDPTQMDPYDRFEPKLPKAVNALAKELVDVMACVLPQVIVKDNDKGQARAIGNGDFLMHMEQRPSIEAKNRYGLTGVLPMKWANLITAITKENK